MQSNWMQPFGIQQLSTKHIITDNKPALVHILCWLVEQGLTSHQTHYSSYQGRVFIGQMTQPTVSKN